MPDKKPALTDEQLAALSPALETLVTNLEGVAARDPSQGVVEIAASLAAYFRTPD